MKYAGTKEDISLTAEQIKELLAGGYVYALLGKWADGTPAFVKIEVGK